MGTQMLNSIITGEAVAAEAIMENQHSALADDEKLLRTDANQNGGDSAEICAAMQGSPPAIKNSSATSGAAVIEHTRQAEKVAGQYVHDNHWNWH